MRIRKFLRVRFVVDPFTEQEKIMAELTPMMQKYVETKEEYKDCILFYPTDVRAMVEQLKVYKQHDIDRSDFIQKFSRRNIMRKMAEDIIQIGKNNG